MNDFSVQTLWDIQQKSGLWKFLKQKNSFFLIGFIYENFIHGAVEQIPETDLCYRFNAYRENVRHMLGDEVSLSNDEPKNILQDLARDSQLLVRMQDARDDVNVTVYSITPLFSAVLAVLEEMRPKKVIGFAYQTKKLLDTIEQVRLEFSSDRAKRIAKLKEEIQEREAELKRLEQGGALHTLTEEEAQERYAFIRREMNRLPMALGEQMTLFEDQLKDFRKEIKERTNKGEILEKGLELLEAKSKDGTAYYATVQLLTQNELRGQLYEDLEAISNDPRVTPIRQDPIEIVDRMFRAFYQANRHITSLITLIREEVTVKHQQRNYLIYKSADAILHLVPEDVPHKKFYSCQNIIPYARPSLVTFWKYGKPELKIQPPRKDFSTVSFQKEQPYQKGDPSVFTSYFTSQEVLRQNVLDVMGERDSVHLSEVVKAHPIRFGIEELIGYYQLAYQSDASAARQKLCKDVGLIFCNKLTHRYFYEKTGADLVFQKGEF